MGEEKKVLSMGDDDLSHTLGEAKPIIWCEELKTHMSSFTGEAIPRIVTAWLKTGCLAMLTSPQKTHEDPKKTVDRLENDFANWSYKDRIFTCTYKRVRGGCIFVEAEVGFKRRVEPLIYSWQDATWLSPWINRQSQLEAQLPQGIVQWINGCRKRCEETPEKALISVSQAPWLQIPLRGSAASAVLGAEIILNYNFRTQKLLFDAFTPGLHSKLAAFGTCLLEALLAEHLISKAP